MLGMRKLLLVALATVVAMGLSVASAVAGSENPDFPHGDDSASEWFLPEIHSVGGCEPTLLVACTFEAESTASILTHDIAGDVLNCHVTLEVDMFEDGSTLVQGVTVEGIDPRCGNIVGVNEPWANQICGYEHSVPVEFWDRIEADFVSADVGPVSGEIFADVTSGSAALVDSNFHSGPFGIRANGVGGSAPYVFDQAIDIESTEDPCPWPELE